MDSPQKRQRIADTASCSGMAIDSDTLDALRALQTLGNSQFFIIVKSVEPAPIVPVQVVLPVTAPIVPVHVVLPVPAPIVPAPVVIKLSSLALTGLSLLTGLNRKLFSDLLNIWFTLDGSTGTARTKKFVYKFVDGRGFFDGAQKDVTKQAHIMHTIIGFIRTTAKVNHVHGVDVPRKLKIRNDLIVDIDYSTIATLDNLTNSFYGMIVDAITRGKMQDV